LEPNSGSLQDSVKLSYQHRKRKTENGKIIMNGYPPFLEAGEQMSEDEIKKRREKKLQIFDEFRKEVEEESNRHIDFTKGLALGLIYGIIGNLFVQFFYQVVEGIVLEKYDSLLVVSSIITALSLTGIIFTTIKLKADLEFHKAKLRLVKEAWKKLRKAIEEE
jgi:hypothetical protein